MNEAVAAQYERWVYPKPVPDLDAPEERGRVAGCGANAAARYAFHHRTARVAGLDLSAASLAHEHHPKTSHRSARLSTPTVRSVAQCTSKRIGIIHFDRRADIQEKDLDERMHATPWFHATNAHTNVLTMRDVEEIDVAADTTEERSLSELRARGHEHAHHHHHDHAHSHDHGLLRATTARGSEA